VPWSNRRRPSSIDRRRRLHGGGGRYPGGGEVGGGGEGEERAKLGSKASLAFGLVLFITVDGWRLNMRSCRLLS